MVYLSHRRHAGSGNGLNIFVLTRLTVETSLCSPHSHSKINHRLINPSKHARFRRPAQHSSSIVPEKVSELQWESLAFLPQVLKMNRSTSLLFCSKSKDTSVNKGSKSWHPDTLSTAFPVSAFPGSQLGTAMLALTEEQDGFASSTNLTLTLDPGAHVRCHLTR